jgi:hypothetical protein
MAVDRSQRGPCMRCSNFYLHVPMSAFHPLRTSKVPSSLVFDAELAVREN